MTTATDVLRVAARWGLNPDALTDDQRDVLPRLLAHSYYNANGMGIAIVALRGYAGFDWAAYIGALPGPAREVDVVVWTAHHGAKLLGDQAQAWFSRRGAPWGLEYRE